MTTMHSVKALIFALVFFLPFNITWANNANTYQIEIILFAHNENNLLEEMRNPHPALPKTDNTRALRFYTEGAMTHYQLLPQQYFLLTSEANKIANAPQYTLITHQAWRQPIASRDERLHFQINKPESIQSLGANERRPAPDVDGIITLRQNSYIQFSTDLIIDTQRGPVVFKNNRRLRAGELYYLENPFVGMLVKVSKVP